MFCYKCGNKIEDNTKFCPACGARQEAVSYTDKPSEVPAVKPAEPAKASKPKNRKKLYTGIIAGARVIVVVAAAIACIHFIWPLEDENTPQEEQLLQNDGYQTKLAAALAASWFQWLDGEVVGMNEGEGIG